MSRWRCIRCETFNESDRKKCIVCDLERKDTTVKAKMSRWRCIRCETFNESDRKKCIVCDLERKGTTVKAKKKTAIVNSCAFPGCIDKAEKGSEYCSKHKGKVCEMCKSDLKLLGEDYCASCMKIIIDNSTKNLKKWNKILGVIVWLLFLVFVIVVMIKVI